MLSAVPQSTAHNAVLLGLPVLSTDVPHLRAGTAHVRFATNWYYLTTYESLKSPAHDIMRRVLLDTNVFLSSMVFTNVVVHTNVFHQEHRLSTVGRERFCRWDDFFSVQTISPPSLQPAPRRGAPLASDVSPETLRKANRAGAFFKTVRGPRADEEDPDYGL